MRRQDDEIPSGIPCLPECPVQVLEEAMGFCRERLSASPALENELASMSKQQDARPGPQQQSAEPIPEGSELSEPASDKENNEGAASDGMRPPALVPSLLGDPRKPSCASLPDCQDCCRLRHFHGCKTLPPSRPKVRSLFTADGGPSATASGKALACAGDTMMCGCRHVKAFVAHCQAS